MAELMSKKASKVVSNNSNMKSNDVCSVQSNNGLIDLDNITTSNNQLITLCDETEDDDDLIMTRNTKNELSPDDKSLQEIIESELALRINSANENDDTIDGEDEEEPSPSKPEVTIKKIIIEPRPDHMDINAEFIGAEMEHYTIVEDPYTYRNGHASPSFGESRSTVRSENVKSIEQYELKEDSVDPSSDVTIETTSQGPMEDPFKVCGESTNVRPDDDVVEDEIIVQSESEPTWSSSLDNFISGKVSGDNVRAGEYSLFDDDNFDNGAPKMDKHRQEEDGERDLTSWLQTGESISDTIVCSKDQRKIDLPWLDPIVPGETSLGQFSDDFEATPRRDKKLADPEEESEIDEPQKFETEAHPDGNLSNCTAGNHVDYNSDEDFFNTEPDYKNDVIGRDELRGEIIADDATIVEESMKTCLNSSKIDLLTNDDTIVDSVDKSPIDISVVKIVGETPQCFIDGECESLLREKCEDTESSLATVQPEVTIHEIEANEDRDDSSQVENENARVFVEDTKSYAMTEDRLAKNEETEETQLSSWMTVEEATNDRNKLAEAINEANKLVASKDIADERRTTWSNVSFENDESEANTVTSATVTSIEATKITTNTTTNGFVVDTLAETDINSIVDEDEDDSSSCNPSKIDSSSLHDDTTTCLLLSNSAMLAPLATPDDETSEFSNVCDNESREEVTTSSSVAVTSTTSTKSSSTKTKKKKIEGVAGNDASPILTPRIKKTKKSKKNDLEKENISVCRSFGDISNMTDVDQSAFGISEQTLETQEKSSFSKFDALSKKSVLHVRSSDPAKVQQQLNSVGQNGDANPNCRSCGKVVFQMEQTKAEGLVWHKNCFRCVQCSKQLNVDNYQSHESTLYCKAHFKELFQPKPVEESDQPASDKPDLGLEELSALNVKSRFQVFEKTTNETNNEIERSPSQVVKRSPSILSKLAKFQAKGMDIGVADDSLNGIPYEESSESEEDEEIEDSEDLDNEIVKAKRTSRERPISFTKMDDIKNRWECTSQQGRRESQREARKEEIAGIRSRLFMGKQGKMKEMYQQAVAESERITKTNPTEEIQHSTHARSIKERFERGEPIATSDGENEAKLKQEKPDEEVIAAGISRKSRSLFLELDATAAKTGRPVTPVNPKTPTDVSRRARDMSSPDREIYRDPDVVRADDRVDEVVRTDTARKMLSIFRQMEEKATKEDIPDGPKPLKCFTPPPEDKFAKATASASEDEEDEEGEESEDEESAEERDPNYVRASDKVEDEFLKQAKNAARAKTLRAKFEQWETTDGKVASHHVAEMDMAQGNGDQASIESASSLRARFESLGSQTAEAPRAQKVKVNRFVEIQTICMDVCESCQKKVYPLEKVETNNKIFHKQCFRCLQCNCVLRMDTFTLNNGKLYCIPHFKQLFIARGNYDEGFGVDPHKNKWTSNNPNTSAAPGPAPITVSNGRATPVANRV